MEIVLGVLLLAAVAAVVVSFLRLRSLRAEHAQANQAIRGLQAQVQQLAHYQVVGDAQAAATEIRARAAVEAQATTTNAEQEASRIVAAARAQAQQTAGDANAVVEQAQNTLARAQSSARATTTSAEQEASRIVAAARDQARQIAGDAYAVVENAKRYEETARAMKNVVEGYGDRYLVPSVGVLDELAEQFGFAEAGERLKAARKRTREMMAARQAGACDYVEANRRDAAENFVVDAFNGKVDSILADVKDDNFGTLSQKIHDAFTLVNHLGAPFRDARVQPAYRDARLDELRWAVVALELRKKEREEQRALKERIREEERAQKEFERAQKEAEKEQEMLRKAMEKARREIGRATADQKAAYEQQLQELAAKLQAAEERGKRATSMAQQTKAGTVYVISNLGSFGENVHKIGMTRRLEPQERIDELGDASVPFEFDVHALIKCDDAPALENTLHKVFARRQVNKVNPRKEFFRASVAEIRAEVERLGLQAEWTLTAACREFRESCAIDQAMAAGTLDERAWTEQQRRSARTPSPGPVASP